MPDLRSFVFSQTALRAYTTCPRQFKLRYLDHLKWPAEMGSPQLLYEKFTREGALFHRMAEQYFLGIDPNLIERQIDPAKNALVLENWRNFIIYASSAFDLNDPNLQFKPEHTIRANFAGYTVEAKFDLLVIDKKTNYLAIYDWKTSQLSRYAAHTAEHGIQTKVYLAAANQYLALTRPNGGPDPNMVYWFAGSPGSTINVQPTADRIANFEADISILIDRISADEGFELTQELKNCGVCPYRSFCGTVASPAVINEESVMEMEEPFPWDIPNFDNGYETAG